MNYGGSYGYNTGGGAYSTGGGAGYNYGGGYGAGAGAGGGSVSGMHIAGGNGVGVNPGYSIAGGNGVAVNPGFSIAGGNGVGVNPGYSIAGGNGVAVNPGFSIAGGNGVAVNPGIHGHHGHGVHVGGGGECCEVGSNCCGSGVDNGFGVTPGVGVGTGTGDGACCIGGPDVACGGAGSACCEPAGAVVTSTGWAYMGPGGGDFNPNSGYQYVGYGAGSYTKEVSTIVYGWKLRPCCLALLCLLLLLPLLWLLLQQMGGHTESIPVDPVVPIPSPSPVPKPIGICTIFGDPHVMTFDHQRSDYYSPGEYFLVKSSTVMIQARYLPTKITSGLGVTKVLAIGGPILKGHKLFVSADTATWDGTPILAGFPSSFNVAGIVSIQLNNVGTLLQKGRDSGSLRIVHIKLFDGTPEGIQIQVNRWTKSSEGHYINVRITMHPQPGQDGHCGNFNGNPADDDRVQVRARLGKTGVPPAQLLFRTKTPVVTANRPNINDCPGESLDAAKETCKKKEHKFIPSMGCLVDVCFGGKDFAEADEEV